MGKISNVMRHYVSNKRRFADLFNGVFFHGKNVIRAEELTEASEQYTELEAEDKTEMVTGERLERIRDIKMSLQSGECLRVLAVENQNFVDYSMPFRCMEYDSMEYRRQLENLRQKNREKSEFTTVSERLCGLKSTDRLSPVYTLCFYHGEEEWTGPLSLKDMMNFDNDDGMRQFFSDYPMQLFYVNEDTDLSVFHTELREVLEVLKYRKDKKKLRRIMEQNPAYAHLNRDTVEALSALLQEPAIWERRKQYMEYDMDYDFEDDEDFVMIPAWKEMLADERTEGKTEAQTVFILNMIKRGFSDEDICGLAECSPEELAEIRTRNK